MQRFSLVYMISRFDLTLNVFLKRLLRLFDVKTEKLVDKL